MITLTIFNSTTSRVSEANILSQILDNQNTFAILDFEKELLFELIKNRNFL